jgi:DNA-directed RNA polymerase subunit RPC12/RpoP
VVIVNDVQQVIQEDWAQGARIRLLEYGDLYVSTTEFMAVITDAIEHIYFLTSDKSDALLFHMKYHRALLDGMDNPELLLPYGWMCEVGEPEETDEEQEFLEFCLEHFEVAPHIKCPHCESRIFDKSKIYRMLRGFNLHYDTCTLECPACGADIKTYGYHEYYDILFKKVSAHE